MQELAELNPEEHGPLRVRQPAPETRCFVEIVAAEFAAAATCCPIFFTKNPDTGVLYPGAMFGFRSGEILVGAPSDGPAPFVPLDRKRSGFYIAGDRIAIDESSKRFSRTDGEPLFESDGTPAPALRAIQAVLTQLHQGQAETQAFTKTMLDLKLIEPIDISLSFDDGEKLILKGLYTISLDALKELDDSTIVALFRSGHLQLAYTIALSSRQVRLMAARRNHRLAEAPVRE